MLACKFAEVGLWGWPDLHKLNLEPLKIKAGVAATTTPHEPWKGRNAGSKRRSDCMCHPNLSGSVDSGCPQQRLAHDAVETVRCGFLTARDWEGDLRLAQDQVQHSVVK